MIRRIKCFKIGNMFAQCHGSGIWLSDDPAFPEYLATTRDYSADMIAESLGIPVEVVKVTKLKITIQEEE